MTAFQAGIGFDRQFIVVVVCHLDAGQRKIVVFIDQTNINAGRTGLTVIAVDAVPHRSGRGKLPNDGVIILFPGGLRECQQLMQIAETAYPRNRGKNRGAIQRILQTLILGEGLPERRSFGTEQLAAVERLHDRNADALCFAAAQQGGTLRGGADAKFIALLQVIGRVQGVHHHFHPAGIQQAVGHRGGMGGKAQMTDNSLRFQLAGKIPK